MMAELESQNKQIYQKQLDLDILNKNAYSLKEGTATVERIHAVIKNAGTAISREGRQTDHAREQLAVFTAEETQIQLMQGDYSCCG